MYEDSVLALLNNWCV